MRDLIALNTFIANYMGYKSYAQGKYTMFIYGEDNHRSNVDLHYHQSLDWLAPVVNKIFEDFGGKRVFEDEHELLLDAMMRLEADKVFEAVLVCIKAINEQKDLKGLAVTLIEKGNSEAPNIGTIIHNGYEDDFEAKIREAIESHFDAVLVEIIVQDNLKPSDVKNSYPLDARLQIGDHGFADIEIQQTWIY